MADRVYDAFISYSRQDRALATRLQRLLEGLEPTTPRVGTHLRVFLDTEELSASPSVRGSIREALAASQFLVVIASPRSVASGWVRAEVEIWLELGRRERLLFLVGDGDPEPLLRTFLTGALELGADLPLAADVRAPSLRASLRRLEEEYLRIAARLLGVEFDDLRQRAVRLRLRRQRQIIAALGAVLVLVTGSGALAVWQWRVALSQRRSAENRLGEAIGVANHILSGTDRELRGIPGAENVRLSLVTEASEMLDRLAMTGSERTSLVSTQLEGHLRRGNLAADQRDYDLAERELAAAERLIRRVPTEVGRARARTLVTRTRGELALARKEYSVAEHQFEIAEPLARSWAVSGQVEAEAERAGVLRLRGDSKAHSRRWTEAERDYELALGSYRVLRARAPDDASLRLGEAVVEERLSRVAEVRRDADQVIRRMTAAIDLIEHLPQGKLPPDGLVLLAEAHGRLSELCRRWKLPDIAARFDKKALDLTFALYMTTPQNARYRAALGEAWGRLGEDARRKKDFSHAKTLFALQAYMAELLLRQDADNVALWQTGIESRAALIEVLLEQQERTEAQEHFSVLRRTVQDFAQDAAESSNERGGALVQAYCLLGEAARQLGADEVRGEAYRAALELAKRRFEADRSDVEARLDLAVTSANMLLLAAGKNDLAAMRDRAETVLALLPDEAALDGHERELVSDLRTLARQVLGG